MRRCGHAPILVTWFTAYLCGLRSQVSTIYVRMSEHVNPEVRSGEPAGYGRRIKDRREELELGQSELAKQVGVTRSRISLWETEASALSMANLERLARALDVTPDWILTGGARGHMVVREHGGIEYDPSPDDMASVAADVQAILDWLPADMSRRWTSKVTTRTRLAEVYAYGASQGWSRERLAFIHSTIERLGDV